MLNNSPAWRSRPRRWLVFAAVVSVAGAGCSDDGSSTAAESPAETAALPTTGPTPTTQAAEDDAAAEPESETTATFTFVDATGEVTLPVTDQRVVALDEVAAVSLLVLGVEPEASSLFVDGSSRPLIEAAGVETTVRASLEWLADRDPDLLLGMGHPQNTTLRDEHLQIAPVAYPDFSAPWGDQMLAFAGATGRSADAERVVAVIDERITRLRAQLESAGVLGAEASILQSAGGQFWAWGPTTLPGELLDQLGFARSEIQSSDGAFGFILLSEEQLADEAQADVVFGVPENAAAEESVFDSPLVDVAQTPSGLVSEMWIANHAFAAWVVLEDIEAVVLDGGRPIADDELVDAWDAFLAEVGS
ncbi:MAG: ABC transporter substrate-binding protein [Actinomycetota bacterium]